MRANTLRRLVRVSAAALCLMALQACAPPPTEPTQSAAVEERAQKVRLGRVDRYPFHDAAPDDSNPPPPDYEYLVYVPAGHKNSKPWPLLVMVHGCGTTAEQQMHANLLNDIADVEGFLVMYPDNGGNCWRAVSGGNSSHRGTGADADQVAGMTLETMARYNVDPERVYMIGMSAGAFQTTATAAAYPEIYAAVGVMAGGGYGMDVTCVAQSDALAQSYAPKAIAEMGERARVIPFIALGGTQDPLGEFPAVGGCSRMAFIESMATNNLLTGGALTGGVVVGGGRFKLDGNSTEKGKVPDGYAWTKEVWRDTAGCQIGERWIIDGMGHYWSGGSGDPQWSAWTDPKGPSASRAAWEFFRRYRKSETGNECAESNPFDSSDGAGRVDSYDFHDAAPNPNNPPPEQYSYKVYVPVGYDGATALPLMVFLHGCAGTAQDMIRATLLNLLADAEQFLVLYPDNLGNCWRAVSAEGDSIHRGLGGDADQIGGMTLETMQRYNVDPERVYLWGGSAGGFQASATAAAYSDLYAAYGVLAGGGYGQSVAHCAGLPDAAAPSFAPQAITEMGPRARVMPVITFGGTTDPLGESPVVAGCARHAFFEGMAINNLLTGGQLLGGYVMSGGRFSADPSSTEKGQVPNGFTWTKEVWRDTSGCQVGERWIIDEMGHTYPGGRSEPRAPDSGRAAWEFFRRYRKSDTGNACAESAPQ
jgi:poly(hydroxyalkanoate) depolymerase family esterase